MTVDRESVVFESSSVVNLLRERESESVSAGEIQEKLSSP